MANSLDEILGDTFDSREIIDRIAELEDDNTNDDGEIVFADAEEKIEYDMLKNIEEDVSGYAEDWEYGTTFISDRYFQDYAQEFAEDIGAIDRDAAWPLQHIDWEAAADELKMDYTSVTIQGEDYWYR